MSFGRDDTEKGIGVKQEAKNWREDLNPHGSGGTIDPVCAFFALPRLS